MDSNKPRGTATRVLIASTDVHETATLTRDLQALSFKVDSTTNGDEAYGRSIGRFRPMLVLMDVLLEGLDGMATCRLLRDTAATAHIPVMLFGTSTALEQRLAAFRAGAIDYLGRPCDRAEVLARIQAHLARDAQGGTHQPRDLQEEPSEDELLVQMTMWYLNERMTLPPSTKQLAQRMGVSERRLSRAFHLAYGKNPRATLLDARLTKARQLLAENRLSIAQIAGFLGYSNTAGFSTAFRQRWGQSPIATRSKAAGLASDPRRVALRRAPWAT